MTSVVFGESCRNTCSVSSLLVENLVCKSASLNRDIFMNDQPWPLVLNNAKCMKNQKKKKQRQILEMHVRNALKPLIQKAMKENVKRKVAKPSPKELIKDWHIFVGDRVIPCAHWLPLLNCSSFLYRLL